MYCSTKIKVKYQSKKKKKWLAVLTLNFFSPTAVINHESLTLFRLDLFGALKNTCASGPSILLTSASFQWKSRNLLKTLKSNMETCKIMLKQLLFHFADTSNIKNIYATKPNGFW